MLYGLSLLLLALWLGVFDIARRTVAAPGLPRYMAVCLLGGYAWLAPGRIAWVATALGWPLRDAALHALGLGFIVSMIMGHAPVILPAIARIKLPFSRLFYLPLLCCTCHWWCGCSLACMTSHGEAAAPCSMPWPSAFCRHDGGHSAAMEAARPAQEPATKAGLMCGGGANVASAL